MEDIDVTLKEIEREFGIDYTTLYNGLAYTGLLARHKKNVSYDPDVALRACDEYCQMRVMKLQAKIGEFDWVRNRIRSFQKNGFTESLPRQVREVP